MNLEVVIYGYIPILIAVLEIIATFYLTKNKKNLLGFIVSFLI